MKKITNFLTLLALLCVGAVQAQEQRSLDADHPIRLAEGVVHYNGEAIRLDEHTLYLDGRLTDAEVAANPYTFNSFQKAVAAFKAGTAEHPMRLYLAPWVYWVDDPDDPYVRGSKGEYPYGMVIKCPYLQLIGLNPDPTTVVLASQRGQTHGAVGNFTMFDFWGDGMRFENLTMGNYCNVDLNYPLNPALNRPKRTSAITQAHVAYCHGDRIVARNVHFISRLNMCPLSGAKRILFEDCHMESTDDALCSTGVYLRCSLDFYGQKPFYNSAKTGAVFLDCDFTVAHEVPRQYFCKAQNPLSIIDCRYHVSQPCYAGWTHTPADWLRCYQYGVTMNGEPYIIGADKPYNTVTLDDEPLLAAYRLTDGKEVLYNTYNLLCGADGWDPQGIRARVEELEQRDKRNYTALATSLQPATQRISMQTGDAPVSLSAHLLRHDGTVLDNAPIRWRVQGGYERYVKLATDAQGLCTLTATNDEDYVQHFMLIASTDLGHEAAVELTVIPNRLPSPTFTEQPVIRVEKGLATVAYALDLAGRADHSVVTWYRATKRDGSDAVPVAVSRQDLPMQQYALTQDDAGYYLVVGVAPKHVRSDAGSEVRVVLPRRIKQSEVIKTKHFETDFSNFPAEYQLQIRAGWWTIDCFKPADTKGYNWKPNMERPAWRYGHSINGATGLGLYQVQKGARLLYTPLKGVYGDMEVVLYCDPAKTAGQGFGSATGQYMDLYIQFDTKSLTGYALRVERTTKYSNAVDFTLVRYANGEVTPLTEPISSPCFRTGCTLRLKAEGGKLTAHVESETTLPLETRHLPQTVDLEAEITPLPHGGTGLLYTGSCGESAVLLHNLTVDWK